jgi:hypothetical protein
MPFDLALPFYTACGLAVVAALTMLEWPKIRVRTYNKTLGGLHVMEIALILQHVPAARASAIRKIGPPPRTEFVIYVTLKTGNL